MKQHPIPQNILDIEFKLFTKFTLKEFVYIAIGVGFGGIFLYLFTKAVVPAFIAIPVFLFSSGTGLFLGLVPINDQKADVFLTNYFRAIRRPTLRVWKNRNFDEKIEGLANEKGLTLTQGTLDREKNGVDESSKSKIIGASTSVPNNQFIEQHQIEKLDQEETLKLMQLEEIAAQADLLAPSPKPIPDSLSDLSAPTTGQAVQPIVTPGIADPLSDRLTLVRETMTQFAIEIEGLNLLENSINIQLVDKNGSPVVQATVMIKDKSGGLIQVIQSSRDGLVITNRSYPSGEYSVQITHERYTFPNLYYILEGGTYPAIRINGR